MSQLNLPHGVTNDTITVACSKYWGLCKYKIVQKFFTFGATLIGEVVRWRRYQRNAVNRHKAWFPCLFISRLCNSNPHNAISLAARIQLLCAAFINYIYLLPSHMRTHTHTAPRLRYPSTKVVGNKFRSRRGVEYGTLGAICVLLGTGLMRGVIR